MTFILRMIILPALALLGCQSALARNSVCEYNKVKLKTFFGYTNSWTEIDKSFTDKRMELSNTIVANVNFNSPYSSQFSVGGVSTPIQKDGIMYTCNSAGAIVSIRVALNHPSFGVRSATLTRSGSAVVVALAGKWHLLPTSQVKKVHGDLIPPGQTGQSIDTFALNF